jgi:hypothetical protein
MIQNMTKRSSFFQEGSKSIGEMRNKRSSIDTSISILDSFASNKKEARRLLRVEN